MDLLARTERVEGGPARRETPEDAPQAVARTVAPDPVRPEVDEVESLALDTQVMVVATLDPALLPDAYPAYASPWRTGDSSTGSAGTVLRGVGPQTPPIEPLAPRLARTAEPQPTLYFFVPESIRHRVEIIVNDDSKRETLLEISPEPPLARGIHSVSLRDHGVDLPIGSKLSWSVVVVPYPQQRGKDVVSSVELRRIELPSELHSALNAAPPEHAANVYASHGFWYEALASLSEFAASHPEATELHERRAALLHQVGLDEAAAFERRGQ